MFFEIFIFFMYYIFKFFEGCFIEFKKLFINELFLKNWEKIILYIGRFNLIKIFIINFNNGILFFYC